MRTEYATGHHRRTVGLRFLGLHTLADVATVGAFLVAMGTVDGAHRSNGTIGCRLRWVDASTDRTTVAVFLVAMGTVDGTGDAQVWTGGVVVLYVRSRYDADARFASVCVKHVLAFGTRDALGHRTGGAGRRRLAPTDLAPSLRTSQS